MGALKPRGMMCPIAAEREGRKIVIRVPLDELGESLVLQLAADEAKELGHALTDAAG